MKKYAVEKTEAEWKASLNEEEFHVLRQHGTERAFSGEYWDFKGEGEYHCRACGTLLFTSETKFDSGCGWPSFFEAQKQAVEYKEDFSFGMHRVEVLCKSCGSHLGHVFQDAPKTPTGQRYCINSICLTFNKKDKAPG
jgi:peptide-methionine (R)-S-oxide reductase